jgi:cell division transport system permease protein
MLERALREAALGLWRTGTAGAVSALAIAAMLGLVGVFALVVSGARGFALSLQDRVEVEIYLREDTTDRSVQALRRHVLAQEGVLDVAYIDKVKAAEEFRGMFGAGLLEALSENPLPTSLRVRFARGQDLLRRARAVAAAVRTRPEVEGVDLGEDLLANLDRFIVGASLIGGVLGASLCVACVFTVSNTAKLMVLAQREAIEVMRLVGATAGFIRLTCLLGGGLLGLTGGLLAAVGIALGSSSLAARLPFEVPLSTGLTCLLLAVLGLGLGVAGSRASLGRVLQAIS